MVIVSTVWGVGVAVGGGGVVKARKLFPRGSSRGRPGGGEPYQWTKAHLTPCELKYGHVATGLPLLPFSLVLQGW